MIKLFNEASEQCSRVVTEKYSTSFYSAIRLLHPHLQSHIFNIYGFVRLADEIVDSFHSHDKTSLLQQFREQTLAAIQIRISLNPILNSFQKTVNNYNIDPELINAFFRSMETDLLRSSHDSKSYEEYIYGSAEVVGLMCLAVFCEGDREIFRKLEGHARSLGAAFQKVNFLRDMKADHEQLSRSYFPGCDPGHFSSDLKNRIESDIAEDFRHAYEGVIQLPAKARFGVYVAYKYYYTLFTKIKRTGFQQITKQRIRIPDYHKAIILLRAGLKNQLRLI